MNERLPTADTKYDRELGRITIQDREYAAELVDDIEEDINDRAAQIETAAQWIRKVRYEAVMADRKRMRSDQAVIYAWLREPDNVEVASLEWLMEWLNRRPLLQAGPFMGIHEPFP